MSDVSEERDSNDSQRETVDEALDGVTEGNDGGRAGAQSSERLPRIGVEQVDNTL